VESKGGAERLERGRQRVRGGEGGRTPPRGKRRCVGGGGDVREDYQEKEGGPGRGQEGGKREGEAGREVERRVAGGDLNCVRVMRVQAREEARRGRNCEDG